jgi:hypothetical protein
MLLLRTIRWTSHCPTLLHPKSIRAASSTPAQQQRSKDNQTDKPFYVSTPIFYVNSGTCESLNWPPENPKLINRGTFTVPHIGHLHSMVIADVLARYNHLKTGEQSFMLTGTDEHGSKVQRAAEKNQQSPHELCEAVSDRFRVCKISNSHLLYMSHSTEIIYNVFLLRSNWLGLQMSTTPILFGLLNPGIIVRHNIFGSVDRFQKKIRAEKKMRR